MRRLLVWIILCCCLYAEKDSCKDINHFSKSQIQTIHYAYHYGKKYDFGFTMAAIAWKESCAGLYRINFDDPSAGIYHAHLPGVIKRHYKAKNTAFRRNAVAEKLIGDIEFASKIALEELLYWKKIHKGHWKNIIKSYNKGFSWQKSKARDKLAEAYYEDVSRRVKILENYFSKNPQLQFAPRNSKQSIFSQTTKDIQLLSE